MNECLDAKGSFEKLKTNIENGKLVNDFYIGKKRLPSLVDLGTDELTLQIYSFDNNITIARERHEESGERHELEQSGSNPIYSNDPFSREWSTYYVLKGNELVTNKKEVKKIISDVTGVNLPVLSVKVQEKHPSRGFSRRFSPGPILDNVVTKITTYKKYPKLEFEEYQPENRHMRDQTKHLVSDFLRTLKGIGFSKCEDLEGKAKLIPEVVEKMFPGLFEEIEREAEREQTPYPNFSF